MSPRPVVFAIALSALWAMSAFGRDLDIRTSEPGARLRLDDPPMVLGESDRNGRLEIKGLPPGSYELRASKEGFEDSVIRVPPGGDEPRTVAITMTPLPTPPTTGDVIVSVGGAGIDVALDGHTRGKTDAGGRLLMTDVAAGEHVIALRTPTGRLIRTSAAVIAGASVEVEVQIEDVAGADEGPSLGAGALLTVVLAALVGLIAAWTGFHWTKRRKGSRPAGSEPLGDPAPGVIDEGAVLADASTRVAEQGSEAQRANPQVTRSSGAEDWDALVGETIDDRYAIQAVLGAGGMGVVFDALDTMMERHVALKVMKADVAEGESGLQRFQREIRIASKVRHPNVVTCFHADLTDEGLLYVAMELVDGVTLGELMRERGALDVGRALSLFCQIAEGLAEAHAQGVVHRDLKPENVLVARTRDERDQAKIMDFGISKVVRLDDDAQTELQLTRAATIMGSPPYMSPEQCRDASQVDHRSDIYSLALVFYEMLEGRKPYEADTALGFITAHITKAPRPLTSRAVVKGEDERVALDAVISRALAKEPGDRFASGEAFKAAATEVLAPSN